MNASIKDFFYIKTRENINLLDTEIIEQIKIYIIIYLYCIVNLYTFYIRIVSHYLRYLRGVCSCMIGILSIIIIYG